jgi:acyl-CoA thioester hydrolase
MGVVWHGNYIRFFEQARSNLLDQLTYNYPQMKESGYLWPIVDMQIKYRRPLTLHQKIIVEAALREYQNRLLIRYKIYDEESGDVLTKAESIQVAVNEKTLKMELECPEVFVNLVKEALGM